MNIYNENMELIQNPDMSKGRLERRTRTEYHPAVEAIEEKWHYDIVCEYPNGGKDVERVIDVPGVEAVAAWEEEVPYMLYVEYTAEELEQINQNKLTQEERIKALEEQLAAYERAYAEGVAEA